MAKDSQIENTKRLMGALVRMKPKQHEEMKLGRPVPERKKTKSGKKKKT